MMFNKSNFNHSKNELMPFKGLRYQTCSLLGEASFITKTFLYKSVRFVSLRAITEKLYNYYLG